MYFMNLFYGADFGRPVKFGSGRFEVLEGRKPGATCARPATSVIIEKFREYSFLLLCYHQSVEAGPAGGEAPRFRRQAPTGTWACPKPASP